MTRPSPFRPCAVAAYVFPQQTSSPKPQTIVHCESHVHSQEPTVQHVLHTHTHMHSECPSPSSQVTLEALKAQKVLLIEIAGDILAMDLYDLDLVAADNPQISNSLKTFNAFISAAKTTVGKLQNSSSEIFKSKSELGNLLIVLKQLTDLLIQVHRLELQDRGSFPMQNIFRDQVKILLLNFVETAAEKMWFSESFVTGPVPKIETFLSSDLWQAINKDYIKAAVNDFSFPNLISYLSLKTYVSGNIDHIREIQSLVDSEMMLYDLVQGRVSNLDKDLKKALEQLTQRLQEEKIKVLKIIESIGLNLDSEIRRCEKGCC